jgi:chromosome segregation ATPase
MPSVSTTHVLGACLLSLAIGVSISYYAMDITEKEHLQDAEARHKKDLQDAETRHKNDMAAAEARRQKDVKATDTRRQREIKFLEMTLEKQREIIRNLRERLLTPANSINATTAPCTPTSGHSNKVVASPNNLVKQ